MDCNSKNLVYLVTCSKCNRQYCGETSTTLKQRFANHRSSIAHAYDLPLAKHFNQQGHSVDNIKIIPIEKIKDDRNSEVKRKEREGFWIYELETLAPKGINKKDSIF